MLLTFFLLVLPRLPSSPLFPYTTLFRSWSPGVLYGAYSASWSLKIESGTMWLAMLPRLEPPKACRPRSEEHTSELQSLTNLVCRLLLEKKHHYQIPQARRPRPPRPKHEV